MRLKLKKSTEYPIKDNLTNGTYGIDVLILFDGELFIGYYNYTNSEWRWNDKKTNTEMTFLFENENELLWSHIPNTVKETEQYPCNNCQGCGCTTCGGSGFLTI